MKTKIRQSWEVLNLPWISVSIPDGTILECNQAMVDVGGECFKGKNFSDWKNTLGIQIADVPDYEELLSLGSISIPKAIDGYTLLLSSWNSDDKSGLIGMLVAEKGTLSVNKALFDKNISGVYSILLDGTIKNCNAAFSRILGIQDPQDLIGRNILDFYFNPSDRDKFITDISEKQSLQNSEIILRKEDGSLVWAVENSYMIEEENEKLIAGTLIDLTEEKLNKERLSMLFQESTDAIILLKGRNYVDCNNRALEIFGYDREELLARDPSDTLMKICIDDPEKADLLKMKTEKVLKGEKQRLVTILRRKDQSKFHGEVYLAPFKVLDGYYVQIIVHDISERVLYERTIRESEERFKLLSDVAIEGIVFVQDGVVVDCNDQFAQLTGWRKRSSVIGKKINDFVLPDDLKRLERMIALKSINRLEVRGVNESGHRIIMEASGSNIRYMDKEVKAFLFYDITSRKRTEQALEQSINRFKGLVENSPNAVIILTDGMIKYSNYSATKLLGYFDEDDCYDEEFLTFFNSKERKIISADLELVREGEDIEYRELKLKDRNKKLIDVGIRSTLTVYDNRPSIQVTINNLSTERLLLQEKMRAQLAEEINQVLKTEIQEHKETQAKLKQAQKFTRNIIESSLDMIIAVDKDMKISEFNTSARRQFGYKAEHILGKPIRKLFADKNSWNKVYDELLKDGFFTGEIQNVKKNGEEFTSFLSASLIKSQDGEIVGSMGVSRDITEMKKAEEELRASEERYRDIFENVLDYILSIDMDGSILYSNASFKENIGYSEKELSGKTIFDLCEPGQLDPKKDLGEQMSKMNLSLTLISKKGEKIIVRGNANVRLKRNKPVSIRAILRNVTEAVEQRAKLESIFNSTENILMWTINKNGKLTSFNKNLKSVWDRDFNVEINTGMKFLDQLNKHVNNDQYQGQLDNYAKTFKGEPKQFEIPLLNNKGENLWLQFFLNPVYYEGKLQEVSCMAYDVTDRKEIDRRILDALKEKEVLLQEVHHRVKNNLQVISSILNLQSSYVNDTETLEVLKESQNRIKSMSYIHETLYQTADFGSIEFSDYINIISRNLIHSYITDAPVNLKTELDQICLSLDQAIPCGLIMNELVSNALKYAFKETEDPQLLVEIRESGNEITLRVKDNGIGLPKDFAFEKSNSLGIQLVYSLVEQLDGELTINAEEGTEFIIRFEKIEEK